MKGGTNKYMFRYAQIDDNGYVVSDSYLSGKVEADNMIPLDDNFDLTNKRFVNGKWKEYIPEPAEVETGISGDEIQAQILLNQADIIAKQREQDEVLAEMLLQQTVKQQEQDEVLAALLLNQMKGGEGDV